MHKLLIAFSICLVFWHPLTAEQWNNIGPAAKVWTACVPFFLGDSLFMTNVRGDTQGTYYVYNLKARSGWEKTHLDNYGSQCYPDQIQGNTATLFTIPSCSNTLAMTSKGESAWHTITIPGLFAYVGCAPPRLFCVAGDTVALGVGGACYDGLPCVPSYYGILLSEDNGNTWKSLVPGKDCRTGMGSLLITGNAIMASTNHGIKSFSRKTLDSTVLPAPVVFHQLYECKGTFFGVDNSVNYYYFKDLYRSVDSCKSWNSFKTGLPDSINITSILAHADDLYLSSNNKGLFIYDSTAAGWRSCLNVLPETRVFNLCARNGLLFAATEHGAYEYVNTTRNVINNSSGLKNRIKVKGLQKYFSSGMNHIYLSDNKSTRYDLLGKKQLMLPRKDK